VRVATKKEGGGEGEGGDKKGGEGEKPSPTPRPTPKVTVIEQVMSLALDEKVKTKAVALIKQLDDTIKQTCSSSRRLIEFPISYTLKKADEAKCLKKVLQQNSQSLEKSINELLKEMAVELKNFQVSDVQLSATIKVTNLVKLLRVLQMSLLEAWDLKDQVTAAFKNPKSLEDLILTLLQFFPSGNSRRLQVTATSIKMTVGVSPVGNTDLSKIKNSMKDLTAENLGKIMNKKLVAEGFPTVKVEALSEPVVKASETETVDSAMQGGVWPVLFFFPCILLGLGFIL